MEIEFHVLDVQRRTTDHSEAVLFGRTTEGKQICVIDTTYQPHFYAEGSTSIAGLTFPGRGKDGKIISATPITLLDGQQKKELLKVTINFASMQKSIASDLRKRPDVQDTFETDIKFERKYLIDKQITPHTVVKATGEFAQDKMRTPVFLATNITPVSDSTFTNIKALAFDIEVYPPEGRFPDATHDPILMLAVYGKGFKRVISHKRFKTNLDYVEFVDSEAQLIERFVELVNTYGPDVLCGYHSDGFDLPYIITRAERYKIKLDLGLDYSEPRAHRGERTTYDIAGIAHFDILPFIRKIAGRSMKTDSYTLDNVAQELLGEKKQEVDILALAKHWDTNSPELESYASYNLKDSELTYRLCELMLPNMIELVKLVGQTMPSVNRLSFSQLVEWFLMRKSKESGMLIPNKPNHTELLKRKTAKIPGAFVHEPKQGIYDNVVIFDFKSLYPTIIVAKNISPDTLNVRGCEKQEQAPVPDERLLYCQDKRGFFPRVIREIITRRTRVKESMKTVEGSKVFLHARQDSLKLLANSINGYFGFPQARWYSRECITAVLLYGREYIKKVIDTAETQGLSTIYSDTDSAFLLRGEKTKEDVLRFQEIINGDLPEFMELEYEGEYLRALFVSTKESETGAKKKYALLDYDNAITIKGFETIRRNGSKIAKEVQRKVIDIILKEQDDAKALAYVKQVIDDLRNQRLDPAALVITTTLQKRPEDYDTISPAVKIGKLMESRGMHVEPGIKIEYVICEGEGKIRDKAQLPSDAKNYDAAYYISNQIVPAVGSLLSIFGHQKDELMQEKSQSKLDSFFG